MHARMPKNFVLEERLERYAAAIEIAPAALRGRWAEACAPAGGSAFATVRLDLGCGKGTFLCEAAAGEPEALFIGVDSEPVCIAYAAQHVMEAGLANAVVVPWDGTRLGEIFGMGELSSIQLNFPTPFPRKKEATKRLVAAEHLAGLRSLLAAGGELRFRTDHAPLFAFACEQLPLAGFEITQLTHDFRAEQPGAPSSEYERKLAEQGATVNALVAVPNGEPVSLAPQEPVSLMDYLPADLTTLDGQYLPHGMARAIENWRNRDLRRASNGK